MVVDAKTRAEITKQGRLYEATKERIVSRIQSNIRIAKEKLDLAERELIKEVEIEFGENPFAQLITNIDSENPPTDEEVMRVLERGIPQDFGPRDESFGSLFKEIEAIKSWDNEGKASPSAPSNVMAESIACDSITLTWDDDLMASLYQIEVNGSKSLCRSTTNSFTKRGLFSGAEYTFRVRSVLGKDSVSEWSDVVKERTRWDCFWKKCSEDVDKRLQYSVNESNPKIATKISGDGYCTIIGSTPLPLNKVTSWSIKVLKSKDNNGDGFHIGVAPFDIDQNVDRNWKCGWYFAWWNSTLWSGPPRYYDGEVYGPRKGDGQYVHTGDRLGVVMDTTKGELSFVVNRVNRGVAYKGIPIDKPLVPCVLLYWGDSVELVI